MQKFPIIFFLEGALQLARPSVFLCCLFSGGDGKKGGRGHRNRKPLLQNPRAQAKKKKLPPSTTAGQTTSREILATSWETNDKLGREGKSQARRARLVGTSWEAIQNHFD